MTEQTATDPLVISVDAMGGDRGPSVVVSAIAKVLKREPGLNFLLHGDEAVLAPLLRRRGLGERVRCRHAPDTVGMADKPSAALRAADGTSMAATLDSVAKGEAQAAVSCGNTGALMAMAMLRLRKAPGVDRPAIAVFWPSDNATADPTGDLEDVETPSCATIDDVCQYFKKQLGSKLKPESGSAQDASDLSSDARQDIDVAVPETSADTAITCSADAECDDGNP